MKTNAMFKVVKLSQVIDQIFYHVYRFPDIIDENVTTFKGIEVDLMLHK